MKTYKYNRPDETAILRCLDLHKKDATAVIIRLAWQAGLLREEIETLAWTQVDLPAAELHVAERTVPLDPPLLDFLTNLDATKPQGDELVLLSDRDHRPLSPQSISRLVRRAMDAVGQPDIRLLDLRHDYVVRQLQIRDWQAVSRFTGIGSVAMNLHFGDFLPEKVSTRAKPESVELDHGILWIVLDREGASPAGLTLALTWRMGLPLEEIAALTWDQVTADGLTVGGRMLPLPADVSSMLGKVKRGDDPHVLLSPRARNPYDPARLSKLVRAALVKAGLDDVTLRDVQQDYTLRAGGREQVTDYIRAHGSITRKEAAALLGVSGGTAYNRLKALVKQDVLVQVGMRYYLPDTVVPPERQEAEILGYVSREDFAYRQDVARLLGIGPRQCEPILKRMAARGLLSQKNQRYTLPREE